MEYPRTPPIRVRRHPERATYDRSAVHAILDEGLVCDLAFVSEGRPVAIPTMYARRGDVVYVHGAPASRMLRTLALGVDVCLTVTLLDGIVLARSIFNHSMNYRSVIVFGRAERITERNEQQRAARALVDHVLPGRWEEARQPSPKELQATLILKIPLEEVSAKVRSGPPDDAEDDLSLTVWAGVIPLGLRASGPRPAPDLRGDLLVPEYATSYSRRFSNGDCPVLPPLGHVC